MVPEKVGSRKRVRQGRTTLREEVVPRGEGKRVRRLSYGREVSPEKTGGTDFVLRDRDDGGGNGGAVTK